MALLDVRKLQYLLIDGDVSRSSLLRMTLKQIGCHNIILANTPQKAVSAVQTGQIDLIIFTMRLPDENGWKFVDWVRNPRLNQHSGLPILGLLLPRDNGALRMAVRRGINYVLLMPISSAHLENRIERTLCSKLKMTRTAAYYGPDRRRMPDTGYMGQDRRLLWRGEEASSRIDPRLPRRAGNPGDFRRD